jgi:hypothetical protein
MRGGGHVRPADYRPWHRCESRRRHFPDQVGDKKLTIRCASRCAQQGDHISGELFLAKESASRFFHYKSSACPTNAPGNDAWRTKINSQKVLYRTALGGGIGLSYCPQSTETHMGKKTPSNLQQDGDAETRELSRPEGAMFGGMSEGKIPLAMASGGRHDHHRVENAMPTVSNPDNADNPHTAEKFLGMVTPRPTRASRPSAPPEPAIADDLLVAKILVYLLDAIGCPDLRCFHQGHGLGECRRPTRLATAVN